MVFNWKKTLIIIFDIAIAIYLLLAVSAFNMPAEKASVCTEVKIDINRSVPGDACPDKNDAAGGFVNPSEIKNILEQQHLYPLGRQMADISSRTIEEALMKNPFVEKAECYKTQSGHICISLRQRTPILHVMASNGDNYYLDSQGAILPESKYASDMIVVTGNVTKKYAQKSLPLIGNTLLADKFWQNQIVQVNILHDGTVEMIPRIGEHIIYLGAPVNIAKKLERVRKFYLYGLNVAGWNKYSYINVEFDNQIICKKK